MLAGALAITCVAQAEVEKPDLKLGFIKLTDCACQRRDENRI